MFVNFMEIKRSDQAHERLGRAGEKEPQQRVSWTARAVHLQGEALVGLWEY